MAASDFYRCRECGLVREFWFDHAPPVVHHQQHWDEQGDAGMDCVGRFDRVWSAPHTGRGSSGEPPR